MSASDRPPEPGSESRLRLFLAAFLRGLLRLFVIVMVAGALVAVFYFGTPALYRRFITPIEENTERLDRFQASQEEAHRQLAGRMDRLQDSLEALETRTAEDARTIAGLQEQLEEAQNRLAARLETGESDLSSVSERLEGFDETLGEVQAGLNRLAATQKADTARLRELNQSQEAAAQTLEISIEDLRRELELVRVMELLLRSRLFLTQSNFGLARQDIQFARDRLAVLRLQVPPYQEEALEAILSRLELALGNLPDRPVIAADDLEIAWQLLVERLPEENAPGGAGPATPVTGASATSTATPTLPTTPRFTATDTSTVEITTTLTVSGIATLPSTSLTPGSPAPSRTPSP